MEYNLYFIQMIENKIMVSFYEEGGFEPLKHKGEVSQVYCPDTFWHWWRDKQDYSGEKISVIVSGAKSGFKIPDDIRLAQKNTALSVWQDVVVLLGEGVLLNKGIQSFPAIKNWNELMNPLEEQYSSSILEAVEPVVKSTGLAALYRKQTIGYKNGTT